MRKMMSTYIVKVFQEHDNEARGKAMEQLYHEDVTWFQPQEIPASIPSSKEEPM